MRETRNAAKATKGGGRSDDRSGARDPRGSKLPEHRAPRPSRLRRRQACRSLHRRPELARSGLRRLVGPGPDSGQALAPPPLALTARAPPSAQSPPRPPRPARELGPSRPRLGYVTNGYALRVSPTVVAERYAFGVLVALETEPSLGGPGENTRTAGPLKKPRCRRRKEQKERT